MPQPPAIIGFRKDRLGARLMGILNVIRLAEVFGGSARYQWLLETAGPSHDLDDPRRILQPAFVARHIDIVEERPDPSGLGNLAAIAPTASIAEIAARIAQGERFISEAVFDPIAFLDEDQQKVRARIAAIGRDLPLLAGLASRLDMACKALEDRIGHPLGRARALHFRRGDLLNGDPWSRGAWPTKFVPDEFCLAWVQDGPGAVILFTDTVGAARHLGRDEPRIVPICDLIDRSGLTMAEHDLLELLLMSRCAEIGGPNGSAFSRAAAAIGGADLIALPGKLAPQRRRAAAGALLDRVIQRPDSFYASGDRAQSAQHAADWTEKLGRGKELAHALARRKDDLRDHPFLHRIVATLALAEGDDGFAADAARRALADPLLVPRDRRLCQNVLDIIQARRAPADDDASADAFFYSLLMNKARHEPLRDQLAALHLGRDGSVSRALMFSPALARALSVPASGGAVSVPPYWTYLCDWEELLWNDASRRPLRRWPDMAQKLEVLESAMDLPLHEVERQLNDGKTPMKPTLGQGHVLGLAASILSLHGRHPRALRLLHWLDAIRPGDPLTCKRLADSSYRQGDDTAAGRYLQDALRLMPDNQLLHLSRARRAAARGHARPALESLAQAQAIWPKSRLLASQRQLLHAVLGVEGA